MAGFALIDAMVGMVLTAIFVMGLSGLWALVADETQEQVLQQKAIYALNGELERLSAMYSVTNFGRSSLTGILGLSWNSAKGFYPPSVIDFVPSSSDDFITQDMNVFLGSDFLVMYDNEKNYVWLNRSQKVMARMSWTETGIALSDCRNFGSDSIGQPCRRVRLNLEYPYIIGSDGKIKKGPNKVKNFPLSTIVGRRR